MSAKSNVTITRKSLRGGALIHLSGIIDETFVREDLVVGVKGVVVFDIGEVRQLTSFGIREWVSALKALNADYYCYINCPTTFITQLIMVAGFAVKGEVVTFQAPYRCRECDIDTSIVLDLRRRDHFRAVVEMKPPPVKCPSCGQEAEFDDFPDLYFQYFLTAPAPSPPPLAEAIIDNRASAGEFRIEKDLAEEVTGLYLSGTLDREAYFRRVADGLQGYIVMLAAGVDYVTPDGLKGLLRFLETVGMTIHLAYVPLRMISALADHTDRLGKANLVSIHLRCSCPRCECDHWIDVSASAVASDESLSLRCPDCASEVVPDAEEGWRDQVRSLPISEPPTTVADYLAGRPHYAMPVQAAQVETFSEEPLGKYRIVRRLGRGGMGSVFLASRVGPGGFKKRVVIKRISLEHFEDDHAIEMFLQEARITARLSHPNIVQIYDVGKSRGEYFLTMEYVDGPDLHKLIVACRRAHIEVPIELACRIASDLCQALHAAHTYRDEDGQQHAIIHRDVSPGNVLITSRGIVKLADFGIAKVADSKVKTRPGVIKGTMRYIPPESFERSDPLPPHPRIDVYGAGVLLYEVLLCKPLFSGPNWVHTMRSIVAQPLPKLRDRRNDIPSRLAEAFERAVARDPDERYQSIADLGTHLDAVIQELGRPATSQALAEWVAGVMNWRRNVGQMETHPGLSATTQVQTINITPEAPMKTSDQSPAKSPSESE